MTPWRGCVAAALLLAAACAPAQAPRLPTDPALVLPASDGAPRDLTRWVAEHPVTVLVFFSKDCPTLAAHDARFIAFAQRYTPRGVAFALVSSEREATPAGDALEARRRGYPFPLLSDPGGRLARALGAQYASHSVVLDAHGRVRYSGAFDSNGVQLTHDATQHVRDAVEALLAGHPPPAREREGLGCLLQLP